MRDIKFRGIKHKTKEWVYGFLSYEDTSFVIVEPVDVPPSQSDPGGDHVSLKHHIDPDTVGEYTGLKDKDGKEIYEGDIVSYVDTYKNKPEYFREVKFVDACFIIEEPDCDACLGGFASDENHEGSHVLFVVGNIHQNPELLETNEIQT